MKIAIVYNRESQNVINLFGVPNREKYGKGVIKRIISALKKNGHQVRAFEGDKLLITNLESFMPRVVKGENPGLVFNLSYGIQGQARYTHVPGMLEMIGIPYVGSNPLAHSLALDKVVAKIMFKQHGLPTPDFTVLQNEDFELPALDFPMIVKPKNESVSFGLRIVNNEEELREGAKVIFDEYRQPVLVEQFIEGREINVGVLGNEPMETLPPVEIGFGEGGPPIYRLEDKTKQSGRTIDLYCPADIPDDKIEEAQTLAKLAFSAIGCYDCARIDFRMDKEGNLYILEINSLPSLGANGSYVHAAATIGLDFDALVNRLVDIASSRYFGTPTPPEIGDSSAPSVATEIFSFITTQRDKVEGRIREWCHISSRSNDPHGVGVASSEIESVMTSLKMKPVKAYTDNRFTWMWETKKGFEGGTLLVAPIDIPFFSEGPAALFRKDPERLYGEGIGASRAPLVMLEYALRALRRIRHLHPGRLGVFFYADEGYDGRYSASMLSEAASKASQVIVLRSGNRGDKCYISRRGMLKYRITAEIETRRIGKKGRKKDIILALSSKLNKMSLLSDNAKRLSLTAVDMKVDSYPMSNPHKVSSVLLVNYYDEKGIEKTKKEINEILLTEKAGIKWKLEELAHRPPFKDRNVSKELLSKLKRIADEREIPFGKTSSSWPSLAGVVPANIPVVCGMGPVAEDVYTPQESIKRISLIQRTLLLSLFLAEDV